MGMVALDLLADARAALAVLWAPGRTFAALSARPRTAGAMALFLAASLLSAAAIVPRTDFGDGLTGAPGEEQRGAGGAAPEPTEFERGEARVKAQKLGALSAWAGAVAKPTAGAAVVALALVIAFWVAGAPVAFAPALAVVSHAALPLALRALLAIPAALLHPGFPRSAAGALLPSSAAALWAGAPPALHAALASVDLFTVWTLALTALGLARLSGASRARAAAATVLPWAGLVAVLMALAAATAAPPLH